MGPASSQHTNASNSQAQAPYHISQQQTLPHDAIIVPPAVASTGQPPGSPLPSTVGVGLAPALLPLPITPVPPTRLQAFARIARIPVALIAVVLAIALYFIWRSPAPTTTTTQSSSGITQTNFGTSPSSSTASSTSNTSGDIQVYIVGAVKHPGVYTLPADARVYQLLQAAGGPLPNANLVTLNMAAKLSDGQEVYVTVIGEVPPTYLGGVPGPGSGPSSTDSGGLVNINTATVDELRQQLHVSLKTAQAIVNYRLQHGNYSSVDQLLQVISKSIYNRIKNLVTAG